MNDPRLQEISNTPSDAEKIKLLLQYLDEVTTTLANFKVQLETQDSLLQTIRGHLSTHDDHLTAHDQHLESHGKHLQTLQNND